MRLKTKYNAHMLKRYAIHFALVFLFAFTQMGLATHEISHVNEFNQHGQLDKKAAAEPCSQCLSYAQVASGLQSAGLNLASTGATCSENTLCHFTALSTSVSAYAARAPPQKSSV